jgi:hypothetical protein
MNPSIVPIPIHMRVEELPQPRTDMWAFQLCAGVVGVDQPLTVNIETDRTDLPYIGDYISKRGFEDVPTNLLNQFVFMCFGVIEPQLEGTDLAFRNIPDITRFIQVHFLEDEAELLIATLRRQITAGLVVVDAGVGYRIA